MTIKANHHRWEAPNAFLNTYFPDYSEVAASSVAVSHSVFLLWDLHVCVILSSSLFIFEGFIF